jgi:fructose-1,6-bisphosphatase/inositol monophosphatase family enzyme
MSLPSNLFESVGAVLRDAAATAVMPRFAALAPGDSELKAPGEIVTIADREAETMISAALLALLPQSRVIGEEACAARPALLNDLGQGVAWIVDPIDGTANYAAGRSPFAMMVALLEEGETVGAWILDPLRDSLAVAELGGGAWIDGTRLRATGPARDMRQLGGIISGAFCPDEYREAAERLRAAVAEVHPTARCAGHEYPLVARSLRDFALYWRTLVWDHAPGALLLTEAGGAATFLDGSRYCPTASRTGLLLTHRAETARVLLDQFTPAK